MSHVETKVVPSPKKVQGDFKNYNEYLQAVQKKYSEFASLKKTFSAWGRSNTNPNIDRTALSSKYKKEDIIKWFTNPDQFEKELRELSSYLYIAKGDYYQRINFLVNLMTLDYVVIPDFIPLMNDKEKIYKEKTKADKYCSDILNKPNIRKTLKAIFKDNAFYGYERKSEGSYYMQKLNPNYCRQGVIRDGMPSIEFDFSYFKDTNEEKLDLYDKEFKRRYNSYKNGGKQWQELNYMKSMCIPLESEDYNFPAFTGVFDDYINIDDFYQFLKDTTELDTTKLLFLKVPTSDEDAEILVDPDTVSTFVNNTAEVVSDKIKIVGMPFEVHSENLAQSKNQQNNGIKEMENLIGRNSGISQDILSSANSSSGLKINLEVNATYVFAVLEKIQLWVTKRLKHLTQKKYKFKIEFLKTTNINRKEEFEMAYKMLTIGGSLSDVISARGMNPTNYYNLLRMESIDGVKDLLQIPESIYTSSGKSNDGGAPSKDGTDLTDSGEKTKDTDGNDR